MYQKGLRVPLWGHSLSMVATFELALFQNRLREEHA